MFKYESEMIPVLVSGLSKVYETDYFTTEFSTGNGVADIVFTTKLTGQSLILDDYSTISLFVEQINNRKVINKKSLFQGCYNASKLKRLIVLLENENFLTTDHDNYIPLKSYIPHTKNLISVEAKLKDWKSGFHQALRYQFYSHQSYLALPENVIHRVDKELLQSNNIGLICVNKTDVKIILRPRMKAPKDLTAYFFLSENFAKKYRTQLPKCHNSPL